MSRFTAHLGLHLLEGEDGRPTLKAGRSLWQLAEPLTYDVGAEGSGQSITVPAGFETDLASIPRLVWNIFPPDGPWAKAAVIHDFLYATCGTCRWGGGGDRWRLVQLYSREEADAVLREAMGVLGVPAWKRQVIWAAVRIGGTGGWGS